MRNKIQDTIQIKHFERIIQTLRKYPDVTAPTVNAFARSTASSGFRKNNKIFAMISPKGQFAVKLPRQRVKELVASGIGERFDPNQGWLMREWFIVDPACYKRWLTLAIEAMEYVNSQG
jgi:hypothetical protein